MNTIILKLILKFVADSCFDIKLSDDNGNINVLIINAVEPTQQTIKCYQLS